MASDADESFPPPHEALLVYMIRAPLIFFLNSLITLSLSFTGSSSSSVVKAQFLTACAHSFIHPFINIEHLLCARHCAKK